MTTTQTADDMFADADLDAENSIDAPTPEQIEADKIAASTPEDEDPVVEPGAGVGVRDLKAFEKGTWQHKMVESAVLAERATKATTRSKSLLWTGAVEAITEWETDRAETDVYAENLYADLLDILGKSNKGSASKIKKVALAVKDAGLVLSVYNSLTQAWGEATRLIDTVKDEAVEDSAAEEAVAAIVAAAPSSTTTVEGAAQIVFSKGVDGAVVALLDALNGVSGENNEAAHRAFFRAVGTEIASRVAAAKPKPEPKAAAEPKPKVANAQATKATPAAKGTPVKKAATTTTAQKVAATANTDGTKKALPVKKAAPVKR